MREPPGSWNDDHGPQGGGGHAVLPCMKPSRLGAGVSSFPCRACLAHMAKLALLRVPPATTTATTIGYRFDGPD